MWYYKSSVKEKNKFFYILDKRKKEARDYEDKKKI